MPTSKWPKNRLPREFIDNLCALYSFTWREVPAINDTTMIEVRDRDGQFVGLRHFAFTSEASWYVRQFKNYAQTGNWNAEDHARIVPPDENG